MEPRGFVGGIYRICEWIMRLSVINVLWIICGLPFFLLIFMYIFGVLPQLETTDLVIDSLKSVLLIIVILAPFTFFPSTSAMYAVVRKWVTGEEEVPLFKTFFRGYKENFKQSLIAGLIFSVLTYILIIDFQFFINSDYSFVAYVFIAFLILVYITLFNFFSMIVHYQMKTFQLIKNAFLISIGKPVRSFTTAVLAAAVLYISVAHLTWLMPFFTGSIIACIAYWNFNLIYVKLQEQVEEMRKKEEEEPEIAAELDREDLVKKSDENNK